MASLLNSKTSFFDTDSIDLDRHVIWNPIPRKQLKVEEDQSSNGNNNKNEDDLSLPGLERNDSSRSFTSKNSAFRQILGESNKLSILSLHPSRSSLSEKLSSMTINYEPSNNGISAFKKASQKFTMIMDQETVFTSQYDLPETPQFKVRGAPLSELLPNTQLNRHSSSDCIRTHQPSESESTMKQNYAKLLNDLCKGVSITKLLQQDNNSEDEKPVCSHNRKNANNNNIINDDNDNILNSARFGKPDPNKKKTRHCNCKNSKCLKLYCECLAHGEYCDDSCNCCECHNNVNKEEIRQYALSLIMEKKPEILEGETLKRQNSSKIVRAKGCNCKKSACLKKYCECYNAGTGCGPSCKCEGCKNPHAAKSEDSDSPNLNTELGSPLSPNLGLNIKELSMSDTTMDVGSLMKHKAVPKNLSVFGRAHKEAGSKGNNLPSLPFLSFENRL